MHVSLCRARASVRRFPGKHVPNAVCVLADWIVEIWGKCVSFGFKLKKMFCYIKKLNLPQVHAEKVFWKWSKGLKSRASSLCSWWLALGERGKILTLIWYAFLLTWLFQNWMLFQFRNMPTTLWSQLHLNSGSCPDNSLRACLSWNSTGSA